ncbi:16019_t:CDS:2, partial [Dentiscutata heterogama]
HRNMLNVYNYFSAQKFLTQVTYKKSDLGYPSNTDIEVSLYFTKSTKSTSTSTPYDQTHHHMDNAVSEIDLDNSINHVPQGQTNYVPDNFVNLTNIAASEIDLNESIDYRPQEQINFPYNCPICQSCYLY